MLLGNDNPRTKKKKKTTGDDLTLTNLIKKV